MIEIIKEIDVEVTKPNIFQALVAKQYDMNTRFLKVTLKDCGTRIDVPAIETAKVVINAERKDGLSKGFDGVINDDGTVTVPLHSWMLELDGTVICDISVIDTATNDNKKLTTTSFTLIVEKAAYGGDDVTNDPQYDVLVSLVETCTEASVAAEEALQKSNEALAKSNEADSKYDACVEATENANAVRQEIQAGGYVESLKELNNGSKFSFWVGTQEEYDAIEHKIDNCFYLVTDDNTVTLLKEEYDKKDRILFEGSIEARCETHAEEYVIPLSYPIADYSAVKVNVGAYEIHCGVSIYDNGTKFAIHGSRPASTYNVDNKYMSSLVSVAMEGNISDEYPNGVITKNYSTYLQVLTGQASGQTVKKITGLM